nr:hypothetical protein Iba_chr06aCG8740 [Ipomoea batatas]GMD11915.1 hypothetical protein Iba_chr06fCG8230 [Ipomoea batatas]
MAGHVSSANAVHKLSNSKSFLQIWTGIPHSSSWKAAYNGSVLAVTQAHLFFSTETSSELTDKHSTSLASFSMTFSVLGLHCFLLADVQVMLRRIILPVDARL